MFYIFALLLIVESEIMTGTDVIEESKRDENLDPANPTPVPAQYSSSASTMVSQASSKAASELSRLCTKHMICFLYAKAALLQAGRQYPDNNIREYTK
ncbi:unnamed protein product [Eruca vesicaria subsp. sativa]|uniref:Uncharacterized protein n=1 Tax=Eruca vesicaria subsp. sativa TaxID=29727 RepID=A0ABC8LER9_ERUVS|nr:unnamed protein product [Eruca vesicaria subsp. sativa]